MLCWRRGFSGDWVGRRFSGRNSSEDLGLTEVLVWQQGFQPSEDLGEPHGLTSLENTLPAEKSYETTLKKNNAR